MNRQNLIVPHEEKGEKKCCKYQKLCKYHEELAQTFLQTSLFVTTGTKKKRHLDTRAG